MVQWLGLCVPDAGAPVQSQGTESYVSKLKTPRAAAKTWWSQMQLKKKKKKTLKKNHHSKLKGHSKTKATASPSAFP